MRCLKESEINKLSGSKLDYLYIIDSSKKKIIFNQKSR